MGMIFVTYFSSLASQPLVWSSACALCHSELWGLLATYNHKTQYMVQQADTVAMPCTSADCGITDDALECSLAPSAAPGRLTLYKLSMVLTHPTNSRITFLNNSRSHGNRTPKGNPQAHSISLAHVDFFLYSRMVDVKTATEDTQIR